MNTRKPLVYGCIRLISLGVAHDIAAQVGWIAGDGLDHTPPTAMLPTTTGATISSLTFSPITGDQLVLTPAPDLRFVPAATTASPQQLAALIRAAMDNKS
jgi:hypothetical protein